MRLFGNDIEEFSGEYRWLSNFSPCKIIYDGISYPSVEHAYVASKSNDMEFRKLISNTISPGTAKRLGKNALMRKDWDDIKVNLMREFLNQKFLQEPYKSNLIETGDIKIYEGNKWGDMFWGVDFYTKKGKNMLGELLMDIRNELLKI